MWRKLSVNFYAWIMCQIVHNHCHGAHTNMCLFGRHKCVHDIFAHVCTHPHTHGSQCPSGQAFHKKKLTQLYRCAGPQALPGSVVASFVINPLTGRAIEGATVALIIGGSEVASTRTKADGSFNLACRAGLVTIKITLTGYTTVTTEVRLLPRQIYNDRIFLVPTMLPGEEAFVLMWDGKAIKDMDFTLDTPYGCTVSWRGKTCTDPRTGAVAQLDLDDTGSGTWKGGPETIRVRKWAPGQYRLYARRYSGVNIMDSKSVVTVVRADGTMQQFHLMRGDGAVTHVQDAGPSTGPLDQVCFLPACMMHVCV
jgi:hypothetical protein